MKPKQTQFTRPMQPWPAQAKFGKQIQPKKQDFTLFYFESGEESQLPLLMLHGLGDEADTWRHIFQPLADDFHTLAIDLPGFGRSDKPDVDYSPQFLMASIIGFLDALNINRTILMGSSLGGMLAHGLAVAFPERVSGLILVGGALYQADKIQDRSIQLMQIPLVGEWLYTRLRKNPDAAFNTLNSVYHHLEKLPKADRDFLYTRVNQRVWSDGQRRAYFSTLRNLIPWMKSIQKDLPSKLRRLEIPTLVIRGEHDGLFSETQADQLLNLQPKVTKFTIQDAGHLPHQEAPEAFLQITTAWLKDNGLR
ncbi:MAG: alpha/beta hydrolase [Brevefilum sp.]|nr:alpha/beta hydrolase [Brevefilum sp.]